MLRRSLPLALAVALAVAPACDSPAHGKGEATPHVSHSAPLSETEGPSPPSPRPEEPGDEDPFAERGGVRVDRSTRFLGEPDWPMRLALATGEVAAIERGRGGRSLAFKITLADGTRGYYKPEQSFSAAHWYAEVASYYLDRELGLGRAIPTIGRSLPWEPLRQAARGDERLDEVTVQPDGTVRGAFIWWVDGGLEPIDPGTGWERWVRVGGPLAVSPYQRPVDWASSRPADDGREATEPDVPERPSELSDLILFDYLTTNVDRWGGGFTNVRTRGEGGPLVYLDNGAGFTAGPSARIPLMDARLHALSRFRRSTVDRIGALDLDRLAERMTTDPLAPILDERQMAQLAERRDHLLEHVAAMARRHGEARVFPWD